MFESKELNRINKLEVEKTELAKLIKQNNPKFLIKGFVLARREYKRNSNKTSIVKNYLNEGEKIGNLLGLDSDIVLGMTNKSILELLNSKFDENYLTELKTKFNSVKNILDAEKAKYNKMNSAGSNKKRLTQDSKNILEYYSKKIPQINVIDEQINVLKHEAQNYKKNNLKEKYNKCLEVIKNLTDQKIKVKSKFVNRELKSDEYSRKIKDVESNKEYREINKKIKKLKTDVDDTSPTLLVKKYKSAKANYESLTLDLDGEPSEIEQEFLQIAEKISTIIGVTIPQLLNLSNASITNSLGEKLSDINWSKRNELNDLKNQSSLLKSKIMDSYSTEDMLYEIFDYNDENLDEQIPKEILVSTNINKVQSLVASLCYKTNKMHLYNEALSGGLMGLTVAVNTWLKQQKGLNGALRFDDIFGTYVYRYAQRAIYEMTSGSKGSKAANFDHFKGLLRKDVEKRINEYIKNNPNMAGMKPELIEELLNQEEAASTLQKPLNSVSETDYNAIIGGDDGNANMWGLSNYGKESFASDEIVNGKMVYSKLLKSISSLMDLFDIKENKNGEFLENKNRKLMDVYDRQIFLMKLGLDYKKTNSEVQSSKFRDVYTLDDIADEIISMKKRKGISDAKMTGSAVSARWDRMIKKLKMAVEYKPEIKKGLEYLLSFIDNNRELFKKLSNNREEILISNERQMLKSNYADNEDILSIEMIDGKNLGDEYLISDENAFDFDDNLEF